ncbi:hypothetical protein N431DRAFT_551222 [Stipitochalara longipes BDJ]|nr:hypothetical protein N431DRAFT_551222 [Stipitochalara longipes BDJ]
MGLRHPISPLTGTDIAERANQTLSELLLLVLELMLIVLFLALGIIRYFSHVDTFLSPAQEARTPTSSSGLLSSPVSSSLPASSGPPSSSPFLESLSTTQSSSPDSSSSSPELFQESSSQSSSSPSSSSPSPGSQSPVNNDKTITLTGQKLLKELGLPATLASFRLLISLGVLDENLLPSSLLAPSPPAPVSSSSPPPYVPPHIRRQASVPSSSPTSSSLPEDSASIRPPLHPSGLPHAHRNHYPWFHYHLAVGTCYLNKRGELCLGPKRDEGLVDPLPFWSSNVA